MEARDLIRQIKEIKAKRKITYNDIMQELTVNDVPLVSRTTLVRVFASGSEDKASCFNYQETLIPIYEAINRIHQDGNPSQEIRELINVICDEKDLMIKRLIDRLDQKDSIIQQLIKLLEKERQ